MMRIKTIPTIALLLWLSACSVLPKSAPPPKRHDLGPPTANQQTQQTLPGKVRLAGVNAASWLNGTTIYYRELNADPTQLLGYARNQWLVPPAQLIATRLTNTLAAANPHASRSASYRLSLRLDDLEQILSNSHHAHTLLRMQAALSGKHVSARKTFTIKHPTPPNINGAVRGTAAAVDQLATRLTAWVRKQAKQQ